MQSSKKPDSKELTKNDRTGDINKWAGIAMTPDTRWTPRRLEALETSEFRFISSKESGTFRANRYDGRWTVYPILRSETHRVGSVPFKLTDLGDPILIDSDTWTLCSLMTAMGATVVE